MDAEFLSTYLNTFKDIVDPNPELIHSLVQVKNALLDVQGKDGKIIIVGNGGSAAIASHFSVDLTKNAKTRCINFNEADLITCFANDYGYEHWVEKAIEFYGDAGDVLIAISSSGQSENILNGCKAANKLGFSAVITLSGLSGDNPLRKMGDINLWVDSRAYNIVESLHQLWLLAIVDLIIGKPEYPV